MIRLATLLGSMSTFDTDNTEESSIAELIRRNSLALATLFGSDDNDCDDQLMGSFPSLLLAIHDGDHGANSTTHGAVELENMAAQSLSSRISVFGKSAQAPRATADGMRICDEGLDMEHHHHHHHSIYDIGDIPQVPNELLNNLCSSFMRLLLARIKAYALLLLRHYSNVAKYADDHPSGKRKMDHAMIAQDEIMELLWSQTFIQTAVTSFQVLPTVDAPSAFSKDDTIASLPIIFEATLDVMILGELTSFRIHTDGLINGTFVQNSTTLLKFAEVRLDTHQLLANMKQSILEAVDSAVTSSKSTSLSTVNNLSQEQLEDVLDSVLNDPLPSAPDARVSHTSVSSINADIANMPPPLPRLPRYALRGSLRNRRSTSFQKQKLIDLPTVSPDLSSRSMSPPRDLECLLAVMNESSVASASARPGKKMKMSDLKNRSESTD